jgi:hypothetical protein
MAPRPRRSVAGPIILIVLGILFLLANLHIMDWRMMIFRYGQFWPCLIILWGVIKLVEYYRARSAGEAPPRFGAGAVILVIFLILFGLSVSTASRIDLGKLNNGDIQLDNDNDFVGLFGGKSFNYDSEQTQDVGSATSLSVNSRRGSVSVQAWEQPQVKVVVHKRVIARTEDQAKQLDQQTQPKFTAAGTAITLDVNTNVETHVVVLGTDIRYVRSDVEVFVPKKLAVNVDTQHGDATVRDREGDVRVSDQHGDVTVEAVKGDAIIDLHHGDVRATNIAGNVTISGRVTDSTVSDVTGAVRFNGEFFGDMSVSKVANGVTFRSSRTDMQIGKLEGDLSLESGDLRVKNVAGPIRVVTRHKDIHFEDATGDIHVENTNGVVEVALSKPGQVSIDNRNSDVIVTLPAKSAFQYNVRARHGDISSDFPDFRVNGTEHNDNSASGSIGNNGPKVDVTNQNGNVEIRKS